MDSRRERWLRQAVAEAARAASLDELVAAATPPLARALGAGLTLCGRFDALGLTTVGGYGATYIDEYQRGGYALDDPHVAASRRIDRRIMVGSLMVDPAELHRTRAYQSFWRGRLGVEDSIWLVLTGPGFGKPGCLGYRFWRSRRQPPYTLQDARWVAPALRSLRASMRRVTEGGGWNMAAAALEQLAGSRRLLAVGLDGHVIWAAPRGAELLGPLLARRVGWPPAIEQALAPWRLGAGPRERRAVLWTMAGEVQVAMRLLRPHDAPPFALFELELEGDGVPHLDAVAERFGLGRAERRVLGALAAGLANKEIAARIGISPATVRTHAYNLFRKLGVGSRMEALVLLRDYGQS